MGDLVTTEFQNAHTELPRTTVVADRNLGDPQVASSAQSPHLEGDVRWILPSPFPEVPYAIETLAGRGELKDSIVVLDLV